MNSKTPLLLGILAGCASPPALPGDACFEVSEVEPDFASDGMSGREFANLLLASTVAPQTQGWPGLSVEFDPNRLQYSFADFDESRRKCEGLGRDRVVVRGNIGMWVEGVPSVGTGMLTFDDTRFESGTISAEVPLEGDTVVADWASGAIMDAVGDARPVASIRFVLEWPEQRVVAAAFVGPEGVASDDLEQYGAFEVPAFETPFTVTQTR